MEMETNGENNKIYELGYIILPNIADDTVDDEVSKVINILESNGTVISSVPPKKKRLEYNISKVVANKKTAFSFGYFGSIIFQTGSSTLAKVKSEIEKDESILRFLIINRTKSSLIVEKKNIKAKRKTVASSDKYSDKKATGFKIDEKELDKSIENLVTS